MPNIKGVFVAGTAAMLLAGTPAMARNPAAPKGEHFYVCANGDKFTVAFNPADDTATLVRRGETMVMERQPTPSGFRFSTGNTNITGTTDQLTLNVPGFPPLACQSR